MADPVQLRARNKRITMDKISGLATSVDGPGMPLNVLATADNVVYDIEGGARKREGFNNKYSFDSDSTLLHYNKVNLMTSVVDTDFSSNLIVDSAFDLAGSIDKVELNGIVIDTANITDPSKSVKMEFERSNSSFELLHNEDPSYNFMFEAQNEDLYISTDGFGLEVRRAGTNTFVKDSDFEVTYGSMAQLPNGDLYLISRSQGLYKKVNGTWVQIDSSVSSSSTMFELNGFIYIGTKRLYKLVNDKLVVIKNDIEFGHNTFVKLQDGSVYLPYGGVLGGGGTYKLENDTLTQVNSLPGYQSWITQLSNGKIYLGNPYGIWRFDGNVTVNITTEDFRGGFMLEDPNGIVYVGSQKGIYEFKDEKLIVASTQLSSIWCYSLVLKNGDVYFGSQNNQQGNSDEGIYVVKYQTTKQDDKLKITFKSHIKLSSATVKLKNLSVIGTPGEITSEIKPSNNIWDQKIDANIILKEQETNPNHVHEWAITKDSNGNELFSTSKNINLDSIEFNLPTTSNVQNVSSYIVELFELNVERFVENDDLYGLIQNTRGDIIIDRINKVKADMSIYILNNKLNINFKNIDGKYDKQEFTINTPTFTNTPTYIDYVIADQQYIVVTTGYEIMVFSIFQQKDLDSNGKVVIQLVQSNDLDKLPKLTTIDKIESVGYNRWLKDPFNFASDKFGYTNDIVANNIQPSIVKPWTDEEVEYLSTYNADNAGSINNGSLKFKWTIKKYNEKELLYEDISTAVAHVPPSNGQPEIAAVVPEAIIKSGTDITKTCTVIYQQPGKYKLTVYYDSNAVDLNTSKSKSIVITIPIEKPKEGIKESILDEIKSCKYVDFLEGKLVFYGNGTQQIYTSLVDDPFYFSAETIVKADSYNKSQEIIAIEPYKDIKVIFTKSTMMSMSGTGNPFADSPWAILPLDGTTGIVGHDAATSVMNTLSFVSKQGINIITQISVADKRVDLYKVSDIIKDLALPYDDIVVKDDSTLMSNISLATVENRLYASYPYKFQLLVFDFSNTNKISDGKWSRWKSESIVFGKLTAIDERLYNLYGKNITVKNSKVEVGLGDVSLIDYYKDIDSNIKLEISTHHVNFGEDYNAKKIKRILIDTSNTYDGSSAYKVSSSSDYQPNLLYNVEKFGTVKPTLGQLHGSGLVLGKAKGTMTTYRPDTNINSKIFMVSKAGRVNNISIEQNNDKPFELNSISIDYITGSDRGRKIKL